jgi:ArsR family transcriptional regulator
MPHSPADPAASVSLPVCTRVQAGLVDCERRGTWVYYWVRPELLRKLSALLEIAAPVPA